MELEPKLLLFLPNEIKYKILCYNDEYTVKMVNDRIHIYEPKYKTILREIKQICMDADPNDVKKWKIFNQKCMKEIYKKMNLHDFHCMLNELTLEDYQQFIEDETIDLFHHLSLSYYQTIQHIYTTKYPVVNEKRLVYSIFWDYCIFLRGLITTPPKKAESSNELSKLRSPYDPS
jgi:hypothetical protein